MRLALATTLLLVVGFTATAKADLVTNANFGPGDNTGPDPVGYGAVTGWTEVSAGGNLGSTDFNIVDLWNNGTLPGGDTTVGFIQQDGSFSQMLSGLTVGQAYQLTFLDNARDLSGDNCCNATPTLTVSVGGSTLLGPTGVGSVGTGNPFNFVEATFVATSATELLQFSSTTPLDPNGGESDGTLLLSDVSVNATPEPSSLMLLGTGILGAAGMMRRRLLRA